MYAHTYLTLALPVYILILKSVHRIFWVALFTDWVKKKDTRTKAQTLFISLYVGSLCIYKILSYFFFLTCNIKDIFVGCSIQILSPVCGRHLSLCFWAIWLVVYLNVLEYETMERSDWKANVWKYFVTFTLIQSYSALCSTIVFVCSLRVHILHTPN